MPLYKALVYAVRDGAASDEDIASSSSSKEKKVFPFEFEAAGEVDATRIARKRFVDDPSVREQGWLAERFEVFRME